MANNSFKVNRGLSLNPQSSAPSTPSLGDVYYDSVSDTYSFYNSGHWINLSSRVDVVAAASMTSADFTDDITKNSLIRITGSTAATIHGISASADGNSIVLYNASSQSVTLKYNSSIETSAVDRIFTPSLGDVVLLPNQVANLVYDVGNGKWALESNPVLVLASLPMIGGSSGDSLESVLSKTDDEIAKLFEDRNVMLMQGGLITFTGTKVQFTEPLKLVLHQKKSGSVPQVISLGAVDQNFTNSGDMLIATVDRSAGTATLSTVTVGNALPAVNSSNQEVFIIAVRYDATDGTQRLYWRSGTAMNSGQTIRLGASGAGSGGLGSPEPYSGFDMLIVDTFDVGSSNPASLVSQTNGSYNLLYRLSCDKTKTFNTTGNTYSINGGAPSFAVAAGDVIYDNASATFRRISSVVTPTTGYIDSPFTIALSSSAGMISQAVWTKDLVSVGSATELTRARDLYPSKTISSIHVEYADSLITGDAVADFTQTPRISALISASGLQSDVAPPTSDKFLLFNRAVEPTPTQSVATPTDTNMQRLFLCFMPNPINASVVSGANVLNYQVSFYQSQNILPANVKNSAFCFTNSSATPINCSQPTVSSGKTRIKLDFPFVTSLYSSLVVGDLEVIVDGKMLPKYQAGSTLDSWWSPVPGSNDTIQLDSDYSSYSFSVQVTQRTDGNAAGDSSTVNTLKLNSLYDAIVGSSQQVSSGVAQYTSLQSAINSLPSGGSIMLLASYSSGENITIASSNMLIEGQGNNSAIQGNIVLSSGAKYNKIGKLRVTGNITLNAGANYNDVSSFWCNNTSVVTDNGSSNYILGIRD